MKNFTFFMIFLLVATLSLTTMAQSPWILQHAIGLPNSVNPNVIFSAVDENVCWGIQFEYNNPSIIRTTDGGLNWSQSATQGAAGLYASSINAIDDSTAWIAMYTSTGVPGGGVFKTTNAGLDWKRDTTAFNGSGGHPIAVYFFDSNNGVVIGNPRNGNWEIYTTTNAGVDWTQVQSAKIPLPSSNEFGGHFASAGNSIWFGTFAGGSSVYRSTDRGMTWSVTRNVPGKASFCVAFKDSLNGLSSNCFGGLGNRINKTTDGGLTWTPIPNVPPTPSTYFISYVKGTQGSYVVTSTSNIGFPEQTIPGSAYSTDDGSSWAKVDSLPHQKAEFVSAHVGWSGSVNDSVYKWDSDLLITSVREISSLAESFILGQNYPNPFNPSTNIQFNISKSSFVNLKVYDILGREVAALVNEEQPAGEYEVEFNASQLSSGIYFYTISADNFVETKKMILLR